MRKLLQFIVEHRRLVSLFVTMFLSVSMMFMGDSRKTSFARSVTTAAFKTGRFTFSWGIYMTDLWRENKRLRIRNLELSDQIHYRTTAIDENRRLRRLLGFRQRFSLKDSVVVATVIGHDMDRVVNTLVIDAGLRDGIRKNMAVLTAEGLVGRVFESYRSSSSVQIIRDLTSKVSAVAESGGIQGIVGWRGGERLVMYGLLRQNLPEKGMKVYTSGVGGVFPPGLYIVTVDGEYEDEVELYASVHVAPVVDFSRVQEVFVLRGSERSDIWNDGDGDGRFKRPETQ